MAGLKLLGIAVVVLLSGLCESRSILESKANTKDDRMVREMVSLLKRLTDLKESPKQVTTASPSTTVTLDVQKDDVSSSHVQLCTDAVSFLSGQEKTVEKRNFVINYVVNYCIRPSTTSDVILLLKILQAAATEYDSPSSDWDWSNWPGFDTFTSPRPQSTTSDYWQQLYDELLKYEDSGYSTAAPPTATEDWFEQFFASLFDDEEVNDEEVNDEEVYTSLPPTTPRSTTEDFALEEAFNDFWNMVEEEAEEEEKTEEEEEEEEEGEEEEGEEDDGEEEGEEEVNALLQLLEGQEEQDNEEGEQTLSTDQPDEDNNLPPLETNKRMKKRLLDLLAKTLMKKRQEMMRK